MRILVTKVPLLLLLLAAPRIASAAPRLEDPVPLDAIRTVLPIRETTLPIRDTVLPINATVVDTEVTSDDSTPGEIHLSIGADVLFDFDQATLKPESAPAIAKVVDAMSKVNGGRVSVSVVGHTDSVGGDDYNQQLSVRRAEAVRAAIARRAAPGASFSVGGSGARQPVAPNKKPDGSDDPQGRARNRRVEIVVKAR